MKGSNQLASRVPRKEMVKGKRPKESKKEPPKESLSAQQSVNNTVVLTIASLKYTVPV